MTMTFRMAATAAITNTPYFSIIEARSRELHTVTWFSRLSYLNNATSQIQDGRYYHYRISIFPQQHWNQWIPYQQQELNIEFVICSVSFYVLPFVNHSLCISTTDIHILTRLETKDFICPPSQYTAFSELTYSCRSGYCTISLKKIHTSITTKSLLSTVLTIMYFALFCTASLICKHILIYYSETTQGTICNYINDYVVFIYVECASIKPRDWDCVVSMDIS